MSAPKLAPRSDVRDINTYPAQVVRCRSASGERRVQNDDAIVLGVGLVVGGEGGVSEEAHARPEREADCVDIEVARTSLAERFLHLRLDGRARPDRVEPDLVRRSRRARERERDTRRAVVGVEHADLCLDHGVPGGRRDPSDLESSDDEGTRRTECCHPEWCRPCG